MISLDYWQSWPFVSADLIAFRQPSISCRFIGICTIKKCLLSHSPESFIIYARRSLRQPTVDRALAIKITTFSNIDFYDAILIRKSLRKLFIALEVENSSFVYPRAFVHCLSQRHNGLSFNQHIIITLKSRRLFFLQFDRFLLTPDFLSGTRFALQSKLGYMNVA